ncbi:zinc finger protein 513-like [Branchiostoma floridae]|uniref:Zinc finger protein 513-like n=1 Tax=Branchiostoma floridae TaxID=7739 RepID=A0A9J7LQ08_BRAFL|nr:zinc finger protein 513-like [Branchiostoma floridae]
MSSNLTEETSFRERPGGQALFQMEDSATDLHQSQACPETDDGGTGKLRSQTHSGERPHRCRECEFATSKMSALKRHVRTEHAAGKRKLTEKHCCPHCEYDGANMKLHVRTHAGGRPHQCPHCEYSASQRDDTGRTHHGETQ